MARLVLSLEKAFDVGLCAKFLLRVDCSHANLGRAMNLPEVISRDQLERLCCMFAGWRMGNLAFATDNFADDLRDMLCWIELFSISI